MQSLRKKTEGFTIIEVMIVLVIAAVIILIVFLAVPALQRNSRNNQRKNDVARVSAAVTELANNANGVLPSASATVQTAAGTLGYYTTLGYDGDGTAGPVADAETVTYVRLANCGGAAAPGTTTPTTGRKFAIIYAVETSTGQSPQCLQG